MLTICIFLISSFNSADISQSGEERDDLLNFDEKMFEGMPDHEKVKLIYTNPNKNLI